MLCLGIEQGVSYATSRKDEYESDVFDVSCVIISCLCCCDGQVGMTFVYAVSQSVQLYGGVVKHLSK